MNKQFTRAAVFALIAVLGWVVPTSGEPILEFDIPLPPELRKPALIAVDDQIAVPCSRQCALQVRLHFGGAWGEFGLVTVGQSDPLVSFVVENDSATHNLAITYSIYDDAGRLTTFQRLTPKVKVGRTVIDASAAEAVGPGLYRLAYNVKETISGKEVGRGEQWYAVVASDSALRWLTDDTLFLDEATAVTDLSPAVADGVKASAPFGHTTLHVHYDDDTALDIVQTYGLQWHIDTVWVQLAEDGTVPRWDNGLWRLLESQWQGMGGTAPFTAVVPLKLFVPVAATETGTRPDYAARVDIGAAIVRMLLEQARDGVAPMVPFTVADPDVTDDVASAWQPTPEAVAYAVWYEQLAAAAYVGELSMPGRAFAYVYLRHGQPVVVAGTDSQEQHVVFRDVREGDMKKVTVLGTVSSMVAKGNELNITLNSQPVYIYDLGLAAVARAVMEHMVPRVQQLVHHIPTAAVYEPRVTAALKEVATSLWLSELQGMGTEAARTAWPDLLQAVMELGHGIVQAYEQHEVTDPAVLSSFLRLLPAVAGLGEAAGVTTDRTNEKELTQLFLDEIIAEFDRWQRETGARAPLAAAQLQTMRVAADTDGSDSASVVAREAALLVMRHLDDAPVVALGVYFGGAEDMNTYRVIRAVGGAPNERPTTGWDTMPLSLTVVNATDDFVEADVALSVPEGWFWALGTRFVAPDETVPLFVAPGTATPANISVAVPFQALPGAYSIPIQVRVDGLVSDAVIVTVQVPEQ